MTVFDTRQRQDFFKRDYSQYMLGFESLKNAMRIFKKPPRTLTKIEASLQSGRKELILNKWALQAKTPGSIVPPHGQVDSTVGFKPKVSMRK